MALHELLLGLISIHALHTEGDPRLDPGDTVTVTFQSTPSIRRATPTWTTTRPYGSISIHALHTEGDRHALLAVFK